MSTADVAGAIRARALARRRIGRASARRLAGSANLPAVVGELAGTPYGRYVRHGQSLAEAEHAVLRTLLWHLRVLAGWQSRSTAEILRTLAGGFEVANIDEHLHRLAGGEARPGYDLGALALAGPRLIATTSPPQLRAALAASPWGDPGDDTGRTLALVPRLAWLRRVATRAPATAHWAAGAALLLLVRDLVLGGGPIAPAAAAHLRVLVGPRALTASTVSELAATADRQARWVLDGVRGPDDLWRAEARWWRRVDTDGTALLHRQGFTGDAAAGCAAVLAADAWRVRAALESAARGGGRTEVFDVSP